MAKNVLITEEEILLVESELASSQSARRRRAAKKIGKFRILELSGSLFNAYKAEINDTRTWETQCEMIRALGKLKNENLLPYLEEIISKNIEFDAITHFSAIAYLRIKGKSNYMPIVFELLKNGKHSVIDGALWMLFYDDVIPEKEDLEKLIEMVNNKPDPYEEGIGDIRETLACLMSKCPHEQVSKYLEEYKNIPHFSKDVIGYALKGKSYCPNEY